jgi:hypothetical protein
MPRHKIKKASVLKLAELVRYQKDAVVSREIIRK